MVAWAVTGQRQTTVSNGITYVPAMIVGFQTEGGNFASVTLTADKYNGPGVTAAVQAAADQIDAIGAFNTGVTTTGSVIS